MSWYAIDAIDDALDASREFLFPFSLGRWARLALITLFVGGGGGGVNQLSNLQNVGQLPAAPTGPSVPADPAQPLPELGGLAVAIAVVVLLVALGFAFVGATFEFVFVDVIERDHVRVISPFGRQAGNGLRLLGFNLAVTVATLLPLAVAGYLAYFAGGPPGFNGFDALGTTALLAFAAVAVLWLVVSGLVTGLTRTLVVPVMVATGTGVLGGWGRLWPRLRDEWKQTLLYLLMHFFVGIGVGIVGLVLTLLGAIVVGIVGLVVGLAAAAVTHGGNVALGGGIGVLAGAAVAVPLFVVFVALPVGILTATYVRTYELASLAGFDSAFDLLGPYRPEMDDGPGGGDDVGGTGDDFDDGDGFGGVYGTPDDDESGGTNDRGVDDARDDEFGGDDDRFGGPDDSSDGGRGPGDRRTARRVGPSPR